MYDGEVDDVRWIWLASVIKFTAFSTRRRRRRRRH